MTSKSKKNLDNTKKSPDKTLKRSSKKEKSKKKKSKKQSKRVKQAIKEEEKTELTKKLTPNILPSKIDETQNFTNFKVNWNKILDEESKLVSSCNNNSTK